MGKGTRIQNDPVSRFASLLDPVDDLPLMVGLPKIDFETERRGARCAALLDIAEGVVAVDRRIAHPEQIEIGAIQNENRRQPQPPWLSRDYMRNLSERPRGSHSTSFQERTGGGADGDHLVRSCWCGGGSPVQPVLLA